MSPSSIILIAGSKELMAPATAQIRYTIIYLVVLTVLVGSIALGVWLVTEWQKRHGRKHD